MKIDIMIKNSILETTIMKLQNEDTINNNKNRKSEVNGVEWGGYNGWNAMLYSFKLFYSLLLKTLFVSEIILFSICILLHFWT